MELGRIGIWSGAFGLMPAEDLRRVMPEIDELGYPTCWFPESFGREAFTASSLVLASSPTAKVATGIAAMWARDATATMNAARTLAEAYPERFVLGIGVSHRRFSETRGWGYDKPYTAMVEFLDELEDIDYWGPKPAAEPPLLLAALGPRMLRLAAERAWAAHPYFVPPEHTALAREIIGPSCVLAPEQAVVLNTDKTEARAIARDFAQVYLASPNYRRNLVRLGWDEEELDNGGSDAVIDAIIVSGDEEAIRRRIAEHFDAGADHVGVQVLNGDMVNFPIEDWQRLAPALRDL